MADQREAILSRLLTVCAAVSGINAVARNQLDVPGMLRPAVVVLDGSEHVVMAAPFDSRSPTVSTRARVELLPGIVLAVRGDDGAEAGKLMTLYRNRILAAVLADAILLTSVTTNGGIRYEGCAVAMPDAEAKEHRLDINIAFTYLFNSADL